MSAIMSQYTSNFLLRLKAPMISLKNSETKTLMTSSSYKKSYGRTNYAILSRLVKTPFVGLPNLLLQEHVFPELIQNNLTPDLIVRSFSNISSEPEQYRTYLSKINDSMRGKGFEAAENAISHLL